MSSSTMFVKTEKLVGASIIAGLGFIVSVWTNLIFRISLLLEASHYFKDDRYSLISGAIENEYVVICLIATATLIWGLTNRHRRYLYPWACLKLCETITIFIGIIIIICNEYSAFAGPFAITIIVTCIHIYASLCVYKAYKRMLIKIPLNILNNDECNQESNEDGIVKLQVDELKENYDNEKN